MKSGSLSDHLLNCDINSLIRTIKYHNLLSELKQIGYSQKTIQDALDRNLIEEFEPGKFRVKESPKVLMLDNGSSNNHNCELPRSVCIFLHSDLTSHIYTSKKEAQKSAIIAAATQFVNNASDHHSIKAEQKKSSFWANLKFAFGKESYSVFIGPREDCIAGAKQVAGAKAQRHGDNNWKLIIPSLNQ